VLPEPKQMLVFPQMGHAIPREYYAGRRQWVLEQVGLR
jgi:hypothetical protein